MAERILIISPVPLFPGHAGNRMRIKTICSALMEHGFMLDYFYTGFEDTLNAEHRNFFNGEVLDHQIDDTITNWKADPGLRLKEVLNGLQIKKEFLARKIFEGRDSALHNKTLYEFKNARKVQLLSRQLNEKSYRSVLLNYSVYSFYFDLFDEKTLKIVDTHDRLADRYRLYLNEGLEPVEWKSISRRDEQKSLAKADVVWAITDDEADYFMQLTGGKSPVVLTVPHLSVFHEVPVEQEGTQKQILTVGGKSLININGLNWFLEQVWVRVVEEFPEAELCIAGSICDEADRFYKTAGIKLLGRFDSPGEVYQVADFCVNPIQFGTGLKIKTIEALSSGKKILTTHEGAAGLTRFIGKGLICTDDPAEWISEISAHFNKPEPPEEWVITLRDEMEKYNSETLSAILSSFDAERSV